MSSYLTVVYTINDQERFQQEKQSLMDKFKPSDGTAWSITAMSSDHEIHRLDILTEALDKGDEDAVAAILGHMDVGNLKSLDDLTR